MNAGWIIAGIAIGGILFVAFGVGGALAASALILGIGFAAAQATENDHV